MVRFTGFSREEIKASANFISHWRSLISIDKGVIRVRNQSLLKASYKKYLCTKCSKEFKYEKTLDLHSRKFCYQKKVAIENNHDPLHKRIHLFTDANTSQ